MKKYEFTLSIDGIVILNRSGNRLRSARKRFYRAIRKTANSLDEITNYEKLTDKYKIYEAGSRAGTIKTKQEIKKILERR